MQLYSDVLLMTTQPASSGKLNTVYCLEFTKRPTETILVKNNTNSKTISKVLVSAIVLVVVTVLDFISVL